MGRAAESAVERIDNELVRAHDWFVRANRRNDIAEETEAFVLMETLFEQRAHLPLQRHPSE